MQTVNERLRMWTQRTFGVLFVFGLIGAVSAAPTNEPIRFQELYELLRANLSGTTEADLSRAAVQGLLEQLGSKVTIVSREAGTLKGTSSTQQVISAVFDRSYGYLRIRRVDAGLSAEFDRAYERIASTNKLKGIVLDLRFAGGQDYTAAVAVADKFFTTEQPLIDWGEGLKKSTAKTNAITLPVAVLANRKTTGSAEALVGILRYAEVGLLIGTNTAGQASMTREFSLSTGQQVRVAIAPVKVVDNKQLPVSGIKADIEVEVSPEDELAYFEDAYKVLPKQGRAGVASPNEMNLAVTNRGPRRRLNEAELVRMNREGQIVDRDFPPTNAAPRPSDSAVPVVNDPSLARAIDLLKGLAVVQQFRSI